MSVTPHDILKSVLKINKPITHNIVLILKGAEVHTFREVHEILSSVDPTVKLNSVQAFLSKIRLSCPELFSTGSNPSSFTFIGKDTSVEYVISAIQRRDSSPQMAGTRSSAGEAYKKTSMQYVKEKELYFSTNSDVYLNVLSELYNEKAHNSINRVVSYFMRNAQELTTSQVLYICNNSGVGELTQVAGMSLRSIVYKLSEFFPDYFNKGRATQKFLGSSYVYTWVGPDCVSAEDLHKKLVEGLANREAKKLLSRKSKEPIALEALEALNSTPSSNKLQLPPDLFDGEYLNRVVNWNNPTDASHSLVRVAKMHNPDGGMACEGKDDNCPFLIYAYSGNAFYCTHLKTGIKLLRLCHGDEHGYPVPLKGCPIWT